MQSNLDQIKEIIRNLPIEDLDELQKTITEEQQTKQAKNGDQNGSDWQIERYKKARKWLDENEEKYINQWVCLEGDKLIAHGEDDLEVHKKAKAEGIEIPFVHHIVPESDWGGW